MADQLLTVALDELVEIRSDPLGRLHWWTCRLCGDTASTLHEVGARKVAVDHLALDHRAEIRWSAP